MSDAERKCLTCGVVKPISEFVRYRRGWRSHCRPCRLAKRYADPVRNEEIRWARREYMRGYQRKTPRIVRPRARDPIKQVAQTALNTAIAAGRVVRPKACQDCGVMGRRLHGHHHDYSLPLDVEWLCHRCHAARHYPIGASPERQ